MFTIPTTAQQLPHRRSLVHSMLFNSSEALEHFRSERRQNPLVLKYVHVTITTAAYMAASDPEVICTVALLLILVRRIRRLAGPHR